MIGIVSAMQSELALFCAEMEDMKTETFAALNYYSGKIAGKDVVVCNCGVGKVNAAMHTQIMIDRYQPEVIIHNGVAGALADELDVFDIVIGRDMVYHDMQRFVLETFGPLELEYHSDTALADALDAMERKHFAGRIASGDWFVSGEEEKNRILAATDALCVDMESAPVAHTAFLNDVRCVVLRVISDKADGSAKVDFAEFEKEAAKISSEISLGLIASL